jgi:peptidyl-prolyl cis-trans isomerase C
MKRGLTLPIVIIVLAVAASGAAAWWHWKQNFTQPGVATVNGQVITPTALAEAMRGRLWSKGRTWQELSDAEQKQLREQCLETLEHEALLCALPYEVLPQAITQVQEQFIQQFGSEDSWRERLGWQGLNEPQLQAKLAAEIQRRGALETLVAAHEAVTEAEAKAWYEAHKTRLQVPERWRASQLFLTRHDINKPDRSAEIAEFHRQIVAGEQGLGALARKFSDDDRSKKLDGDLGWFSKERMPVGFMTKVSAMKPGEMSAPFETEVGWHIVILQESKPARPATFNEMKAEIMAKLENERRLLKLDAVLKELRSKATLQRDEARIAETAPAS